MNIPRLRSVIHAFADALCDALEAPPATDPHAYVPPPPPKKKRGPRRGSGLRTWEPTAPITELGRQRANEIAKQKGL